MTYTINHRYVDQDLNPSVSKQGDLATVHCSASGLLPIRYPGRIRVFAGANYHVRHHVDDGGEPGSGGSGLHGGWSIQTKTLPLTVQIKAPNGQPFTADHVTLGDLANYRDLRGTTQGTWSYSVHGQSAPIFVEAGESEVTAGDGHLTITIEETVPSQSAPPLVSDTLAATAHRRYTFDLYRVGTFVATADPDSFLATITMNRVIKLFDPDGVEVATSGNGHLTFPVTLEVLDKSRDIHGVVRPWALEVFPSLSPIGIGVNAKIRATVIATARIRTQTLKSRIDDLLGVGGSKVSIYGEMQPVEQRLLARLKILDEYSAETIDMHKLLDSRLKKVQQDPGVDISDIKANVAYNLANQSRNLGHELHVSLYGVKVKRIDIDIGASQHIQPAIPAIKLRLLVDGDATVKLGGFPFATVSVSGNRIALEAGLRRNADGSFSAATWIDDGVLDVDVHWAAAVAAGIVSFGLLALGAAGAAEYIEDQFNDKIAEGFHDVLQSVMSQVPRVLEVILGGEFTYRSMRLEGNDIVFDYIAPLEPEPKPSKQYLGIIGRSATQIGPEAWQIMPPSLGDTWSAQNLHKIDHIVMVMMENRSFDHVLGYLAQLPGAQNADGLTTDLMTFLALQGFPIPQLNLSGIVPNALGFKTEFPISVGHHLADMTQQLSERLTMPSGRMIISPKGFVDNFHASDPISPFDVLGYYVGDDLPITRFLTENYAHCQRFFASHAGPTLPNRMYSLSGDVQYDRTGEPILDNNKGDNLQLSRAMNIFDLLTRKRIGWRVYESPPSVSMLRMFARYATDDTNIVDIARLQQDVNQGNPFPAVTIIEPAMHHAPENDDHPTADMYNGQLFLKRVYDTLRSNNNLWQKTLLIISYDEHGGFYDHVIPPIADVRTRPMVLSDGGAPGIGAFTPPTLVTNYGVRVPNCVVSPWTPAGKGPDIVLDHCSILKTILARFCGETKPFVSDRVNASRTLDAYLSEPRPRMNVPASPALASLPFRAPPGRHRSIETEPISRKKMLRGDVDFHELTGMVARMLGR